MAENKELNAELLFIDLIKSEENFSPTTMYNDYAVKETLFHWQSQNAARPDRGKGLSYIGTLFRGVETVGFTETWNLYFLGLICFTHAQRPGDIKPTTFKDQ